MGLQFVSAPSLSSARLSAAVAMRDAVPLPFSAGSSTYLGCYVNRNADRVESHVGPALGIDMSNTAAFDECRALAAFAGKPYFGLEDPTNTVRHCLLLDAAPSMASTVDSQCEAGGLDGGGHRLGGAWRLAVYSGS